MAAPGRVTQAWRALNLATLACLRALGPVAGGDNDADEGRGSQDRPTMAQVRPRGGVRVQSRAGETVRPGKPCFGKSLPDGPADLLPEQRAELIWGQSALAYVGHACPDGFGVQSA